MQCLGSVVLRILTTRQLLKICLQSYLLLIGFCLNSHICSLDFLVAGARFELAFFWLWARTGTNSSHPAIFKGFPPFRGLGSFNLNSQNFLRWHIKLSATLRICFHLLLIYCLDHSGDFRAAFRLYRAIYLTVKPLAGIEPTSLLTTVSMVNLPLI